MSSLTEIQILRAEGEDWKESSLGCYVSGNNELLEIITPINASQDENKVQIPSHMLLRLIIKSMSAPDTCLASVSVPIRVLPTQGYIWLPLQEDMESDYISHIPESISHPRVLISISTVKPVPASLPLPSVPVLEDSSERFRLQMDFQTVQNSALLGQIEAMQRQLEIEQIRNRNFEDSFNSLKSELEIEKNTANRRETQLLELLKQKDGIIANQDQELLGITTAHRETYQRNLCLQSELNVREPPFYEDRTHENSMLITQIDSYKQAVSVLTDSLVKLEEKFSDCKDNELQQLVKISAEAKSLQSEVSSLLAQIPKLEREASEKDNLIKTYKLDLKGLQTRLEEAHLEIASAKEKHSLELEEMSCEMKILQKEYLILQEIKNESLQKPPEEEVSIVEAVNSLGMGEDFVHSHDNFFVFMDTLLELQLIKGMVYVCTNRSYVLLEDFINKLNDSIFVNNKSQGFKSRENRRHSKHFLLSTLSSQQKLRGSDTAPLRDRNKAKPFK